MKVKCENAKNCTARCHHKQNHDVEYGLVMRDGVDVKEPCTKPVICFYNDSQPVKCVEAKDE